MVLAVCRRVLRHRQDAEDAVQATFLVLARRAGEMKSGVLLGGWLYGVAYRTALGALRAAAVRREREARAAARRSCEVAPDVGLAAEWREALDREVAALPAVYRAAVVACDLEGLTRSAAAVQVGWTGGHAVQSARPSAGPARAAVSPLRSGGAGDGIGRGRRPGGRGRRVGRADGSIGVAPGGR